MSELKGAVMTGDGRQQKRFEVREDLIAEDGFWAVNLSEAGIALCAERYLEPDTAVEITLMLPSGNTKVTVRVVWCEPAPTCPGPEFLVGAMFIALSLKDRRAIKKYIAECPESWVDYVNKVNSDRVRTDSSGHGG